MTLATPRPYRRAELIRPLVELATLNERLVESEQRSPCPDTTHAVVRYLQF